MKIYNLAFLLLLSFACIGALQFLASPPATEDPQNLNSNKPKTANIVVRSTDGGETWQDISEGLPEILRGDSFDGDGLLRDGFFANESGFHLRVGDGIYHSRPGSTAPFWQKEIFADKQGSIAPGNAGMFAYDYEGQFLQKKNGTNVWSPVYESFQGKEIRSIFETGGGTAFIGSEKGLFKSTDSGETWKQVYAEGSVGKLVASNGVLVAASQRGIIRSTDDGENWDRVISEGGVGIAIERIDGGFAAITYNAKSMSRRVRTSYDGGKTWQPIDDGLPAHLLTASIVQAGENFFCGHPAGIFRSSDLGKTWKLILPATGAKVFNLFVSGSVVYAISRNGGC